MLFHVSLACSLKSRSDVATATNFSSPQRLEFPHAGLKSQWIVHSSPLHAAFLSYFSFHWNLNPLESSSSFSLSSSSLFSSPVYQFNLTPSPLTLLSLANLNLESKETREDIIISNLKGLLPIPPNYTWLHARLNKMPQGDTHGSVCSGLCYKSLALALLSLKSIALQCLLTIFTTSSSSPCHFPQTHSSSIAAASIR